MDIGPYARIEREHRFLLAGVPAGLDVRRTLEIVDWYVVGTRLRLRLVREAGRAPVHKLGHKVRPDQQDGAAPAAVAHTTMYLSAAEFATMIALPALELRKTRRLVGADGFAVDEFHGALDGLVLAEVDVGAHAELPAELPWSARADVSDDVRFAGGTLAATSADQLRVLLAPHRR